MKNPTGQSKYRPSESPVIAHSMALLGATIQEIATAIGVDESTIDHWIVVHPEFAQAIHDGRDVADARVAQGLYKRATGYTNKASKVFGNANTGAQLVVEYEENIPPDPGAAMQWLSNRQRAKWRNKQDVEVAGNVGMVVTDMTGLTDDELEQMKVLAKKALAKSGKKEEIDPED